MPGLGRGGAEPPLHRPPSRAPPFPLRSFLGPARCHPRRHEAFPRPKQTAEAGDDVLGYAECAGDCNDASGYQHPSALKFLPQGISTQVPNSNPFTARFCGLDLREFDDTLLRAVGKASCWLVTGVGAGGESPLGAGDKVNRPNTPTRPKPGIFTSPAASNADQPARRFSEKSGLAAGLAFDRFP